MDLEEQLLDSSTEKERKTKMEKLICLLIGYLFGLFQTGYFYGKLNGVDIRNLGSGNAGTTNALRTLGVKAGLITLLGDVFKCAVAVLVVKGIYSGTHADILPLLSIYAGFGAVLGHNYPFYLGFKGGKGIAAMAGMILSTDLRMTAICLIVFILIVAITRYVSLGSLVVSVLFLAQLIVAGQLGQFGMEQMQLLEMYGVGALFVISAFWRHRANIARLKDGTENKISFKKK